MSPLARASVPLSIECKCQEKLNVWSCLEQAKANCPKNVTPCLIFSRNRAPTYAVVPWEFLLKLLQNKTGGGMDPKLVSLLRELAAFVPMETDSMATGDGEATGRGVME